LQYGCSQWQCGRLDGEGEPDNIVEERMLSGRSGRRVLHGGYTGGVLSKHLE
jgi:hypothetical protein